MGLLAGQEKILDEGMTIAEEINAKELLFGYIYCHFPVLMMMCNTGPNGWSRNSCHIELDMHTFNKLIDMGAIKPVDNSNIVYANCNIKTNSNFVNSISVPYMMCKVNSWVLDEYDVWHKGCIDRGDSDAIENMKNRLKQHMIDYYNKNYECYGIA